VREPAGGCSGLQVPLPSVAGWEGPVGLEVKGTDAKGICVFAISVSWLFRYSLMSYNCSTAGSTSSVRAGGALQNLQTTGCCPGSGAVCAAHWLNCHSSRLLSMCCNMHYKCPQVV